MNREIAPKSFPLERIKFPSSNPITLDNGVQIHSISLGEQDVFKFEYTIRAGATEADKAGIASLANALMKRGTSTKSAQEINTLFDFYGAFWDIQTSFDHATCTLYGLKKHFKALLPELKAILFEANFPQQEFDKEIEIEIQKNRLNWQKTSFMASQTIRNQLFGDTGYGRISTPESLALITNKDLIAFHTNTWLKKSPMIFLSGKISTDEIHLVKELFGTISFQANDVSDPIYANPAPTLKTKKFKENAQQSSIRLGHRSIGRADADYFKFTVLNTVLGGFFGSRLQKNIREEKGFTYGISSSIVPLAHGSYWVVGTDINKEHVEATCAEIKKEMQILRDELIPQDELDIVKNYLLGSFVGELTQAFDIADKVKVIAMEGLDPDFYDQFQEQITACTPEELKDLANKYLHPLDLHEVVVGA